MQLRNVLALWWSSCFPPFESDGLIAQFDKDPKTAGRKTPRKGSLLPFRVVDGSTDALVTRDHAEVGTLSGQAISALSGSLQPGIRFLRDPLPAALSQPLRAAYLRAQHRRQA